MEYIVKQLIKAFIQEAKQNPAKPLQYFMLVSLFGLAFLLPAYGIRRQAQETAAIAGQERMQEEVEAGEEHPEEPRQQSGTVQEEERGDGAQNLKGTIVLDAGHGGFDGGMVGSSGISEKELNLVYARKLEALLTEAGYRVVQTRETEDGLYDPDQDNKKAQDMQRRCAIITQEQPLVTISIHQNSYPGDASVCGPQVFYFEQSQEGERLAAAIQKHMNAMPDVMKQRVQKGNSTYYILKRSASTTVIVECGFLTNAREEALLQTEGYQDQVVKAICDGIVEYLEG